MGERPSGVFGEPRADLADGERRLVPENLEDLEL
jgi:hypothetical protein